MEATLLPRIDNVAEIARGQLRNSPYASLRRLSYDVEESRLVLRGRLPNFHHKQLAQEAVRWLAGVRQIINETEVVD